jgi:hypothetical protein
VGLEIQFTEFFTSTLHVSEWAADSLATLPIGKRVPSACRTEGRVDPNAGLGTLENRKVSCLCWESKHDFLVF